MNYKNEILLAAKIYPLRIIYNDDSLEFLRRHEEVLSTFYDIEIIKNILNGDSEYESILKLVEKAEELSLSEHEKKGSSDTLNLKSVFSRVSISSDEEQKISVYYNLRANPIHPEAMPVDINQINENSQQEHLKKYVKKFDLELDRLVQEKPRDINAFNMVFDRILYKYLWCVSSSKYEGEDISLYDHSKIMTAIMSCLIENEESLYLAMCDFSGIQKYIFSVANTSGSGVSKRLRARSFFVDLMIRTLAQYMIDRFSVGRENILLDTGGKFYVILPDREDTENLLKTIIAEIDEYLFNKYKAQVSVNFAWQKIPCTMLQNYSDVVSGLTEKLRMQKQQPFGKIIKNSVWNEETFIIENDLRDKHLCASCKQILIGKNDEVCEDCGIHLIIGEKLPKTSFFVYFREERSGALRIFKDYYVQLEENLNGKDVSDAYCIECLNDKYEEQFFSYPAKRIYMANHVPINNQGILSFWATHFQGTIYQCLKGILVIHRDYDRCR